MAQGNSTRERALEAALELFSHKGYEAVTMGDIADALGIKAPSLYKYFKGKEDIFSALDALAEEHYRLRWEALEQALGRLEHDAVLLGHLGAERLEQDTLAWFSGELTDPRSESCRRVMAGQPGGCRWLWDEPLGLYEGFFSRLIDRELSRRGEPHVMAVEYLGPLFQLLALRDRDPGRGEVCLAEAKRHIRQFHRVFALREPRTSPSGVGRLFRR